MSDKGLSGGMFDFNGDGKLNSFEKAAEFATFMELISESEKSTQNNIAKSRRNSIRRLRLLTNPCLKKIRGLIF